MKDHSDKEEEEEEEMVKGDSARSLPFMVRLLY